MTRSGGRGGAGPLGLAFRAPARLRRKPAGTFPLRRGALLLAFACLATFAAGAEPVPVPGGPDGIRRLLALGGRRAARDFFLDVNRALLADSSPRDPWEKNGRRRAVALFAKDLAEWRAGQGCPAVLSARGEAWAKTRGALEWIGYRVSGDGPGFEAEPRSGAENERRQAFLGVLGQPATDVLRRLSGGETVTVACADGEAELPFGLEAWRETLGVDETALTRENAFLHFVTHVPASRMLVALHSVDARTREEARTLTGPAGRWQGWALLYRELLDGFERFPEALELRDGRVRLPGGPEADAVWADVVGASPADRESFVRKLFAESSRKAAYVADALRQLPEPAARAFVLGRTGGGKMAVERFQRLYGALEQAGKSYERTRRYAYDFTHLVRFLAFSDDGSLVVPGGSAIWLEALAGSRFPEDEAELEVLVAAARERSDAPEELLWRLFRQEVDGAVRSVPAQSRFLVVSSLVRARPALADPATLVLLFRGLERLQSAYAPLEDLPLVDPVVVRRFLFTLNRLDTTGRGRSAELRAGLFQASVDLLAAFCRGGSLRDEKARDLVRSLLDLPLFAVPNTEPSAGIGAFDRWLQGELLAALREEEALWLAAGRGDREARDPDGETMQPARTSDELVTSALAGRSRPVTLEWRGGRYRFDPSLDGASQRGAFVESQRCVLLSELEGAEAERGSALRAAREGDVRAMQDALLALLERLSAGRPAGREEDARVLAVAADARVAFGELAPATGGNALASLEQRLARFDALRAERTLEALVVHVYSSSAGDPADLAFADPDLVRRHGLAWGDRRSGMVESPFGPTRLERLEDGRGSRIAGSFSGLAEILGDLRADELVHDEKGFVVNEVVRTCLIAPVVHVTPARLDDDALRFVALSCRAAEEFAEELGGRPEAARLEAWSALAQDLVPPARRNGLAAASPAEVGDYLTPSDLYRIGRRLALGGRPVETAVPAARAAREAWTRLASRTGEAEASRRVAELGPRPLAWAGRSRPADLDMPAYERLAQYRGPQLFAERLYDLKVAVARAVFEAGDPAALLPLSFASALDDLLRGATMGWTFDWRPLAMPDEPPGKAGRDRVLEEALQAGRIMLAEEEGQT